MKLKEEVLNCYKQTAAAYAQQYFQELEGKPLDRLLLNDFAQNNMGPVLDVGCGCGHTTRFLYQAGVQQILGVDLSPEMIQQAQLKNQDINLTFQVDNILESSLPSNHFQGVIAFYAIVHFTYTELERAFEEIYRLTKKGGAFLFSFHIGKEVNKVDEFLGKKVAIEFYFFEVEKVLELLKKQQWEVSECVVRHPYEGKEYPSHRAYIRCKK